MNLIKKRKKESLKYSILDGSFHSAMVSLGESFFVPFAIFLKATSFELSILATLPLTIGSILQVYTQKISKFFNSRKNMVLFFVALQSLMYVPIALVFFFSTLKIIYLIIFAVIYMSLGMFISPIWMSWMGDLVDEKDRGKYFGERNEMMGFVAFITYIMGGYLLQKFTEGNIQIFGFMILFLLAMISRLISFYYLKKKYEPKIKELQIKEFTFIEFIKDAKDNNYGRFVIYLFFMNLSLYIAAPFFTPYMLKELKFDYLSFVTITGMMVLVKYMMMPVWGRLSDTHGTKKVLAITGFMMPFVPLLWIFSSSFKYLIIIQILSGFVWAGFELATFNFLFDATTHENRTKSIAYYNALNGVAILIGGLVGGFILTHSTSIDKYLFIFSLSFILRLISSIIFLPRIKEVRRVQSISNKRFLIKFMTRIPGWGVFIHVLRDTADNMDDVLHDITDSAGKSVESIGKKTKK